MKRDQFAEYTVEQVERYRKLGFVVEGTSVVYDEELVSINGMRFTMIKDPGTTMENLRKAEARLRADRDCVGAIRWTDNIKP